MPFFRNYILTELAVADLLGASTYPAYSCVKDFRRGVVVVVKQEFLVFLDHDDTP
jgi:hypothetical protein